MGLLGSPRSEPRTELREEDPRVHHGLELVAVAPPGLLGEQLTVRAVRGKSPEGMPLARSRVVPSVVERVQLEVARRASAPVRGLWTAGPKGGTTHAAGVRNHPA